MPGLLTPVLDECAWVVASVMVVASFNVLPIGFEVGPGFLPLVVVAACFELELESSCAALFFAGGIVVMKIN